MKRRNLLKTTLILPAALRPPQLRPQARVYRPDFDPRNVDFGDSSANHTLDGRSLPLSTPEENAAARPMLLSERQRATLRRLAAEMVPGSEKTGAAEFLEFLAASAPPSAQGEFTGGLDELERSARERYRRSFGDARPAEIEVLLAPLRESWTYLPASPPTAFLRQIKSDLWRFAHTGDAPRTYWYEVS